MQLPPANTAERRFTATAEHLEAVHRGHIRKTTRSVLNTNARSLMASEVGPRRLRDFRDGIMPIERQRAVLRLLRAYQRVGELGSPSQRAAVDEFEAILREQE